jgi:hypothetical protein
VNWVAKQLKKGNKITVTGYETGYIIGKIERGDRVVLIPLPATVKVGDIVYCKPRSGWYRASILTKMKDGDFRVKEYPNDKRSRSLKIKFEDIYGMVYEIKKHKATIVNGNEYVEEWY